MLKHPFQSVEDKGGVTLRDGDGVVLDSCRLPFAPTSERCGMLRFVAKASQALEIMRRRKWFAQWDGRFGKGWWVMDAGDPNTHPHGVLGKRKAMDSLSMGRVEGFYFTHPDDPFAALIAADAYFRAQEPAA